MLGAVQLTCGIALAAGLPFAGIAWTGNIATIIAVTVLVGSGMVAILFAPSVAASRLPSPYFIFVGAIGATGVLGFIILINYDVNQSTLAKNHCLEVDPLMDRTGWPDCNELTARIGNDNMRLLSMIGLCIVAVGAAALYLVKARRLVYA